jgi:hypothetical protein
MTVPLGVPNDTNDIHRDDNADACLDSSLTAVAALAARARSCFHES